MTLARALVVSLTILIASGSNGAIQPTKPPMQAVDLNVLRKEVSSQAAHFVSKNDEFYPLKSDRQKKEKNVIYPAQRPTAINAFLTDETKFATFSPPGMYEKKSPRAKRWLG